MSKLQMAHDWAMKHGKSDSIYDRDNMVDLAWDYADKMQAKEDERVKKKAIDDAKASKIFMDSLTNELEWQPDWSQSPDWANWWAMDADRDCYWHSCVDSPFISSDIFEVANPQGHTFQAPSFKYQGDWRESLRKRP